MSRKLWKKDDEYEHNAAGEQLIPSRKIVVRNIMQSGDMPEARIQGQTENYLPGGLCYCGYSFAWYDLAKEEWLCEMCGEHARLSLVRRTRTVARYVYNG